jgi:peptidyl-prolyl cis-trans isomerase B (cyclophilin B)
MKKLIALFLLIPMCLGLLASCDEGETTVDPSTLGETVSIAIKVKEFGTIKADLYPKIAPLTVAHIVSLIQEEFYDGLIFHRVIEGFMIQGGDPTGTGRGEPGQATVKGEFSDNGVNNTLSNARGVLAMARKGNDYNSGTSQFFINTVDNARLDGQYATFGMVTEGMDVVDAIASVQTDANDKPLKDVVIETIRIEKIHTEVTTTTTTTTAPEENPSVDADPVKIVMEVENFGTVKAELYPNVAPITVAHIKSLIEDGFYDGLIFHRVIEGFMIQGGDPTGTGLGEPGQETIKGEFAANGVDNPLKNTRGVLAMARKSYPYDSATSQFFINTVDNPGLDGQYATFGMVTEGMDVVDAIAAVETNASDKPLVDVVIKSIRIEK